MTALDDTGKEEGIGRVADIEPVTFREMCEQVKKAFALDSVKAAGDMKTSGRYSAAEARNRHEPVGSGGMRSVYQPARVLGGG